MFADHLFYSGTQDNFSIEVNMNMTINTVNVERKQCCMVNGAKNLEHMLVVSSRVEWMFT